MGTQFHTHLVALARPAAAFVFSNGLAPHFAVPLRPRFAAAPRAAARAPLGLGAIKMTGVRIQTHTHWAFGAGAPTGPMRPGLDRSQALLEQELANRGLKHEWAHSSEREAMYLALAKQTLQRSGAPLDDVRVQHRAGEILDSVQAFMAEQDELLGVCAPGSGPAGGAPHALSGEISAAARVLGAPVSLFTVDHTALLETSFVPPHAPDSQACPRASVAPPGPSLARPLLHITASYRQPPSSPHLTHAGAARLQDPLVLIAIGPVMYSAGPAPRADTAAADDSSASLRIGQELAERLLRSAWHPHARARAPPCRARPVRPPQRAALGRAGQAQTSAVKWFSGAAGRSPRPERSLAKSIAQRR